MLAAFFLWREITTVFTIMSSSVTAFSTNPLAVLFIFHAGTAVIDHHWIWWRAVGPYVINFLENAAKLSLARRIPAVAITGPGRPISRSALEDLDVERLIGIL